MKFTGDDKVHLPNQPIKALKFDMPLTRLLCHLDTDLKPPPKVSPRRSYKNRAPPLRPHYYRFSLLVAPLHKNHHHHQNERSINMMPLHLINATLGVVPLTIVHDNAKLPSDELLEKSCTYRRKRKSAGSPPVAPKPVQNKPSRWDAIPVSKKLPSMMPRAATMSLNECARMSLRRPGRWVDDNHVQKVHQPLRRPTRSSGYADAASILELALAEVDFEDDLCDDFSEPSLAATI